MLSLITAVLLPACMVTAHAVVHSDANAAALTAHVDQTNALAIDTTVVDALDLSLGDTLSIDEGEASGRRLLARKKKDKKKSKKKSKKRSKKKSKKRGTTFKWKGRGKNGLKFKSNRPKGVWKNGEIVYDADGIKCVAKKKEADQIAFSKSAELHATAVAEAVEYLCNPPDTFSVTHLEDIFKEDEAVAFAHAAVEAKLKCKSKGKDTPETCVSYSATATAIAEATASAHAEAAASALASCPCMTVAVAEAFASADLYIELVADASVTAEATVCVTGKSSGKSVVWEECTSVIYAKLFARAIAHAATFGTCMSADALVQLEAYASAEITKYNTPQCDTEPVCVGCDEEPAP